MALERTETTARSAQPKARAVLAGIYKALHSYYLS